MWVEVHTLFPLQLPFATVKIGKLEKVPGRDAQGYYYGPHYSPLAVGCPDRSVAKIGLPFDDAQWCLDCHWLYSVNIELSVP